MSIDPVMLQAMREVSQLAAERAVDRGPRTRIRTGTVQLTEQYDVMVIMDGDDVPIMVQNITAKLLRGGQRVVVMFAPPHGAYVIGTLPTEYAEYTPVLKQITTVTTSTAIGRWTMMGQTVHAWGHLVASSSGFSSNYITVSLPIAAHANCVIYGQAYYHTSASNAYLLMAGDDGTHTAFLMHDNSDPDDVLGSSPDLQVVSGHYLDFSLHYEAALTLP